MKFRPEEITRKVFLTTLRGYDRVEVEQYLRWVAADYEDALDDLADLAAERVAPSRPRPRHAVVEAVDPLPVVLVPLPIGRALRLRPQPSGGFTVTPVPALPGSQPAAPARAPDEATVALLAELREAVAIATVHLEEARVLLAKLSLPAHR